MAISYVGGVKGGRAGSTSTTTQSLSGTLSGGSNTSPSAGDLVVVWVSAAGNSSYKPTSQTVSGNNSGSYTYETFQSSADTYYSLSQLNYKIQGATVDTSLTIPASGNARCAQRWVVHVFRGVRSADILDVSAVPKTGIDTGRPNPDPITPSTSGAWIAAYYASATATTGTAYTAASGLSGWLGGTSNDTYACMQGGGYYSSWTSGAYNPAAITAGGTTGSDDAWTAMTIALRPEHAPTVALGTPDDNASISDSTPDLKFTGTDGDSDSLDYQVQVDTTTTFDSTFPSHTFGVEGFETGSSPFSFTSLGNLYGPATATINTSGKIYGANSIAFTCTGADGSAAAIKTHGSDLSEVWVGASIFLPTGWTTGGTAAVQVISFRTNADADVVAFQIENNGTNLEREISIWNTITESWVQTGIQLAVNQINTIQVYFKQATSGGGYKVWVNNTTSGSPTYDSGSMNTGATAFRKVVYGLGYAGNAMPTYYMDNCAYSTSAFMSNLTGAPLIDALSTGHTGFSAGSSHPTASGAEQTYTVGDYDDFNDNSFDATRWTRSNATQVTEQNSELELASTAAAGYYFATSAQKINLTGRFVSLKWVDEGNTAITSYEAYPLELGLDSNNKFSIYNTSGTVYFRKTVSGSPTTLASEAYSATGHLYLRIRESSGTVYFDKSSDGSTWNNVTSTSVASSFAVTSLDLVITVGTWQVEGSTTIMKIDDVKYGYQLSDGTYYWRVRAIDPSGGNTWGAWSPGDSTLGYDHFHLTGATPIAPQDVSHTLNIDNTTITQNHVLTMQDIGHGLYIDGTTIAQNHAIIPQDIQHGLNIDTTTTQLNSSLEMQDLSHGLAIDNTTISQNHVIPVDDIAFGIIEDNGGITQNHIINGDDISLGIVTDIASISQLHVLSASDISHQLSVDATAIQQNHVVAVDDVAIGTSIDDSGLSQNHVIPADDISFGLSEDETTIIEDAPQEVVLYVSDISHSLVADTATITQNHVIAVDDISFGIQEDGGGIVQNHILSVSDISHGLSIDSNAISQNHSIAVDDISFGLTEDNGGITQNHVIITTDITHGVSISGTTISQNHVISPQDIEFGVSEDNAEISIVISPDDLEIGLMEDIITIEQQHVLSTAGLAFGTTPRQFWFDTSGNVYIVVNNAAGILEKV